MIRKRLPIILATCLWCLPVAAAAQTGAPQLGKSPVKDVVAAMTREEKATIVVGAGMSMGGANAAAAQGPAVGNTNLWRARCRRHHPGHPASRHPGRRPR